MSDNLKEENGYVVDEPRRLRTIIVRKKPAAVAAAAAGGIGKFDEYIQKSGLEPKTYQREGVEFCLRREQQQANHPILGGIIADEMGLGKTIVMMGLILANLAAYRRTLIVVPVALIAQWVAQIKRTIIDTGVKPDLSVLRGNAVWFCRRVGAVQSGATDLPRMVVGVRRRRRRLLPLTSSLRPTVVSRWKNLRRQRRRQPLKRRRRSRRLRLCHC